MEKRIEIEYNLDMQEIVFDESVHEEIHSRLMERIMSQYSQGITSGELVENIEEEKEYTFYGWFSITEYELNLKSAIGEIRLYSDKQIVWRNKSFPSNCLTLIRGKYCDFIENETCVTAYLTNQ